jgi:hypothetical protein
LHATDRREHQDDVLAVLMTLVQEVSALSQGMTELRQQLRHQSADKLWYSTAELAEAMSVSQHTVQERWCNQGRIACEKDPDTAKWRIPAAEYQRLVKGGGLRPARR